MEPNRCLKLKQQQYYCLCSPLLTGLSLSWWALCWWVYWGRNKLNILLHVGKGINTQVFFSSWFNFPFLLEYIGAIPAEKREEVIQKLNREATRLIQVCVATGSAACLPANSVASCYGNSRWHIHLIKISTCYIRRTHLCRVSFPIFVHGRSGNETAGTDAGGCVNG